MYILFHLLINAWIYCGMYLKITSEEQNTSSAVTMPANAFQNNVMLLTSTITEAKWHYQDIW